MKLFFVLNYFALFILILQLGAIRPHIVPPTLSYGLVGEKSILDRPVPSQVREPARFVLEANAFFVDSFAINVGDRVTLPPDEVPLDLR